MSDTAMTTATASASATAATASERRINMLEAINEALDIMMDRDPDIIIMGEDVGYFGGVFRATAGLQEKYGKTRVFDTPISNAASSPRRWGWGPMGCGRSPKSSSPITSIPASTS